MVLKNVIGHFNTVTKHRWEVFKLCLKAGIPIRGILHDLSKYSPVEFFEGVKYYQGGTETPIAKERELNGYSKAWLHHKGRNKHHHEYWYDYISPDETPLMPYKYIVEMICDNLAAGLVYNGKNWTRSSQLEYFNAVEKQLRVNERINKMREEVFTEVCEKGIDPVINKRNLKRIYDKYAKEVKEINV